MGVKAYTSVRSLEKTLTKVISHKFDAVHSVLEKEAKKIFDKSQMYVPVESGALKSSGKMTVTKPKNGIGKIVISYGDELTNHYAMHVHENLEKYHKPPTRAKFLQAAIQEELPGIEQRLASEVRKNV